MGVEITGNGQIQTGLGGVADLGESQLDRSDDGALRIDVSAVFETGLNYFGRRFAPTDLWVNTNGTLSFGAAFPAYPTLANAAARPDLVAIFWADVDTRLRGEGRESGVIHIDVDPVRDVVSITWLDVGVYRRDTSAPNRFQLQLYDRRNGDFDIIFRYDRIGWSEGSADGDAGARVLLSSSRLASLFQLVAVGTDLTGLDSLTGNTGTTGLWVFPMRNGAVSGAVVGGGVVRTGGAGADTLAGTAAADQLDGGAGDDVLAGGDGQDTLEGGIGNDRLDGGAGDDVLSGGEGTDMLYGGDGLDVLNGGMGDDLLFGGAGNDVLSGGDGRDTLEGGIGNDRLDGGAGDDVLSGGDGADTLTGNDGNDRLDGGDGADTLTGGGGDDFLFGGSSATDLRDLIYGGDGHDHIDGGAGNDELHGGLGNDTINGSLGADTLIGNEDRDVLSGGGGSDLIFGNAGDDFINGGFGYDRMNGGAGADVFFHLGIADHASDWIQDYTAAEGDVLRIGIAGATRAQFQVNYAHTANAEGVRSGTATVAEAFVIYRPTGQILWALVDGAGQSSINLQIGTQMFDLMA
jgi:serralysin